MVTYEMMFLLEIETNLSYASSTDNQAPTGRPLYVFSSVSKTQSWMTRIHRFVILFAQASSKHRSDSEHTIYDIFIVRDSLLSHLWVNISAEIFPGSVIPRDR